MKKLMFLFFAAMAAPLMAADNDRDGLPDSWEVTYGFNTTNSVGNDGPFGDPDRDGLNNLAEYQIAEVYRFWTNRVAQSAAVTNSYPLCPTNSHSRYPPVWPTSDYANDVYAPDYFARVADVRGAVYFGFMFTDHDFVEDAWESRWPANITSKDRYDPNDDADGDGWSNYAECRARTDPTRGSGVAAYPVPVMKFTICYAGVKKISTVKVEAYSSAGMNGYPDAIYYFPVTEPFPVTVTVTNPVSGHLREGSCWFVAHSGETWNEGSPLGVLQFDESYLGMGSFFLGATMGYDVNRVSILLKDSLTASAKNLKNTHRIPIAVPDDGIGKRVLVRRHLVDGIGNWQVTLMDKRFFYPRSYIHEGDFGGVLDVELSGVPDSMGRTSLVYTVYSDEAGVCDATTLISTFTNIFAAHTAPVPVSPIDGAYVTSSKPTFSWTSANEGAWGCRVEVRTTSGTGPIVFLSGDKLKLQVGKDGVYSFTPNLYANSKVMEGLMPGRVFEPKQTYAWRVSEIDQRVLNKYADEVWSEWNLFRTDISTSVVANAQTQEIVLDESGKVGIPVILRYYGPGGEYLQSCVKIRAYDNRAFAGSPVTEHNCAYTALERPVVGGPNLFAAEDFFYLCGLEPSESAGPYYVMAFLDLNSNTVRDPWESWGYANGFSTPTLRPYDPVPVLATYSAQYRPVTIYIEDADSDRDWIPDGYEFDFNPTDDFLNLMGPHVNGRMNPWLIPYWNWVQQ